MPMENIQFEDINDKDLEQLTKYVSLPVILFDSQSILYLTDSAKMLLAGAAAEAVIVGNTLAGEVEICREDGAPSMWLEYKGKRVNYEGRAAILAQLIDITAKKQLERDLSRLALLRTVMLDVTKSILRMNGIEEMCHLVLKSALTAIKGASLGTVLLKTEGDSVRVASYIGFDDEVKNLRISLSGTFLYIDTAGRMDRVVNVPDLAKVGRYFLVKTDYGEGVYIKSTLSAPIYVDGALFGMINIDSVEVDAFDADDEKAMEFLRDTIEIAVSNHLLYSEKTFLAIHDPLTRVYNRGFFAEQLEIVIERARRYSDTFALVLFDIDGLKLVNDSFGHLIGDRVLETFAREMQAAMRKSDILSRFGGDEFVGLFFNTDPTSLTGRLEDTLARLKRNPIDTGKGHQHCSASYGIAQFPMDGTTHDELIRVAGERLYAMKLK